MLKLPSNWKMVEKAKHYLSEEYRIENRYSIYFEKTLGGELY